MPSRDEIELPLRGRPLRDRYVLRLIAVDRALHFVGFLLVAALLLLLAVNRNRYQADVTRLINDFQGTDASSKPHGLLGERRNGEHAAIKVVISRSLTGLFDVVNAWSPVDDCALTVREDRLTDCRSHAWTFAGAPFSGGDRPLQAFPVTNQNGSLIVDFTHPVDAEG